MEVQETIRTASIVNISDQQFVVSRRYAHFVILGRKADARFSTLSVTDKIDRADIGDGRHSEFFYSARQVAEDICQEINSNAGLNSFLGVFVAAGDTPTQAELDAAQEKLHTFYRWRAEQAETEWGRSKNPLFISDLDRRAARELGITRDWCYEAKNYVDCPACGTRIMPSVAVCPACMAVINEEKARKFFPERFAPPPAPELQPARKRA